MDKTLIIKSLEEYKSRNENKYKLKKLGLFGSVLTDKFDENSDIDIIIEQQNPDMFELVTIKNELEKLLGKPVDIVRYRNKMNVFLKKRIDRDAVYV